MPIGNITQSVSVIPAPPHRGVDVQTVFVTKQEDFQDHLAGTTIEELNTLKDQLNTRSSEINSTATTMNEYADTASAGASTATTKAGEASTSASGALTSRNQAETFKNNASASATKASQWADNNYNVEVETGKYSAKHWATVAQSVDVANKVDKDMSGYVAKVLPINTDLLPLSDSEDTFGIKKLSIENLTDYILNDSALTGAPTAPTPTSGDNSGKIATTEFVKNNVGVNLSGTTAYHLLSGNLSATINANYVEASATTTRNYTTSDYIFDSLNNKLYDCILASTAGALLTNTTYFTLITAGTMQLNTALVPFANGIDSNGAKNTIVYKNETITGLTLTAGKNYVYAKNDGTYGVKAIAPSYGIDNPLTGDFYNVLTNKWYDNTDSIITESRNYLDAIVHADANGQVAYVEELPKIEYKDIVKANEFQGKNACTAWVNLEGTTTPPTIRDSYNVSAVIRTSAGIYDIYFKEAMDNINYTISHPTLYGTSSGTVGAIKYLNKVTLSVYSGGTLSSAFSDISITIFGGKN